MKHYFFSLLLLPCALLADTTEDRILQELEKLNAKVDRLEAQVTSLEKELSEAAAVVPAEALAGGESVGLVDRVAQAIYIKEDRVNFPWMDAALWERIEEGMSEAAVIGILGEPTLDEPSLHKRIDKVLTYQGRRAATGERVVGKIKFYKDKAVSISRP